MADVVNDSESDSDEDGVEYSGMEQPPLIKQLKSILREYRDDGQYDVCKIYELIQNAEDAEATEVKILYDSRHVNSEPVDERKRPFRKYFKGPALVVYNNAKFTEQDWKGIKMLYTSIKEDDPLKVGRFGLGFKSVFHITDYPVIVSGDRLLILDPHMKNPGKVCQTIKLKNIHKCKGMQKSDCLDALLGIFGFNLETIGNGFSGTLLRFPLRNKVTELSDNIYDESKVNDLIKSFQAEASVTLLFLKSLECVEVFQHLKQNDDPSSQQASFVVKLSGANISEVRKKKRKFLSWMKNRNPDEGDGNSCFFEVTIKTEKLVGNYLQEDENKWFIYNLYKDSDVSEEFGLLCKDQSLGYCPYVGVAVPMTTKKNFQGHIFCFLPLPLDTENLTGLPVHVNGFFALDQNRRHLKWATDDQLENQRHREKPILWNEHLVSEALSEVYLLAMKKLIEESEDRGNPDKLVSTVVHCIPKVSSKRWNPLLNPLFENLLKEPFLFTKNEIRKNVLKLVAQCQENIVQVSSDLWNTLKNLRPSAKCITPKYIRSLLRNNSNYKTMSFEERIDILQFALVDEDYGDLVGLELLPLQDRTFACFQRKHFSNDTIYSCTEREVRMFPGLEHRFVSTDLPLDVQTHIQRMSSDTGNTQIKNKN
ncbi:hypothetical protein KUTeg_017809 [Tegillarca granosa]|uniref:Sacsin/Nov domain-containing protein n=1 Tax=Tegillarca granosa TaxID=220873 RepID=A0ABQ9EK04_TEGGR|nr:hypothetical protein KUTeg_017809 [Tegillarca granosa]